MLPFILRSLPPKMQGLLQPVARLRASETPAFSHPPLSHRFARLIEGGVGRVHQRGQGPQAQVFLSLQGVLEKLGFEKAAVRIQGRLAELQDEERDLARRHLDLLFADQELVSVLFSCSFGDEENLQSKEQILCRIEREGLPGYLEVLVSALNQYWSTVSVVEELRSRGRCPLDAEYETQHRRDLKFIAGLLDLIEQDRVIRWRFMGRWRTFSQRSMLIDIQTMVAKAPV